MGMVDCLSKWTVLIMNVSYNRDENRISVKGGNPIKSNQKTSEMNLWGQV